MSVEDILSLELEGLSETIKEYCRENYILSYTKKIQTLSYPEDKDMILKLATRLFEWYNLNLDNINESKFITNKSEHEKSIQLLSILIEELTKAD